MRGAAPGKAGCSVALVAVAKPHRGLSGVDGHDQDLGRTENCPVVVLKAGVVRSNGQLVDPSTGIILNVYDAYETVRGRVRTESLGSVIRFKAHPRFR